MLLPEDFPSVREFVSHHRKLYPHHAPFWGSGEIAVRHCVEKYGPKNFKELQWCDEFPDPTQIILIGSGNMFWTSDGTYLPGAFFFDLDVNHGSPKMAYISFQEALEAAKRLKTVLPQGFIFRSTNAEGIHIKASLGKDVSHSKKEIMALIKGIVHKLGIKHDPSALGRQFLWHWCRNPQPNSFELIEGGIDTPLDLIRLKREFAPDTMREIASRVTPSPIPTGKGGGEGGSCNPTPASSPLSPTNNLDHLFVDQQNRTLLGDRNFTAICIMRDMGLSKEDVASQFVSRGLPVPEAHDIGRIFKYPTRRTPRTARNWSEYRRSFVWDTLGAGVYVAWMELVRLRAYNPEGEWSDSFSVWMKQFGAKSSRSNSRSFWLLSLMGLIRTVQDRQADKDGKWTARLIQIRLPKEEEKTLLSMKADILKKATKGQRYWKESQVSNLKEILVKEGLLHSEGVTNTSIPSPPPFLP